MKDPASPFQKVNGFTIYTFTEMSYKDYVLHYTNFNNEGDWTFERVFTLEVHTYLPQVLTVTMSVRPSVCLSGLLAVCLSVRVCLSINVSVCQ